MPPFLEQKTLIEFGLCPNDSEFIRHKFFFKHALIQIRKRPLFNTVEIQTDAKSFDIWVLHYSNAEMRARGWNVFNWN